MTEQFTTEDAELLERLYADTFCIIKIQKRVYRHHPATVYVRSRFAGTQCFADVHSLATERAEGGAVPIIYDNRRGHYDDFIAEAEDDIMRRANAWAAVHRVEM